MNTEQLGKLQQVSDLMDGRLRGADIDRAVATACAEPQTLAAWDTYHLIGDVLRDGAAAASVKQADLWARLRTELADSKANLRNSTIPTPLPIGHTTVAANDARWRLLAGLASIAAVGAIAWGMAGRSAELTGSPQLSQVVAPVAATVSVAIANPAVESAPQIMIRDAHLDALLAAHKQFGGTSALQMPAGFVRNATFEAGVSK